ncbi:exosome non-catalytic core component [Rhodotorula diobovata]|uniref:Exosome non-catalytic core component n=1 Tax=Rhodotorula diobovata TaxID=5288 RepID=A0A5C5G6C8_9BASI|nr:exosome non-catalytic core component [Rhodotorula diobovata]
MDRTHRSTDALRPLALSQGLLSRADGSAQFAFGNVAVLASLTGPAEVRIRDELVDRATLDIHLRPLRGAGGPPLRSAESTLASLLAPLILLHLYPRALLQLTLQTVSSPSTAFTAPLSTDPLLGAGAEAGGDKNGKGKGKARGTGAGAAEKAARINAAVMALVDGGVQLRGMLVAVAVAVVPVTVSDDDEEELRLDPTPQEELASTSTHVFAFSFGQGVGGAEGTCVGVDSVGSFAEDQLFDAQDLAQSAAQTVLAFIRRSVETKYGVAGAPPPAQTRLAGGGAARREEAEEEGSDGDSDDDDQVMIDA